MSSTVIPDRDFIKFTFIPCLSAWPKRCHKFPCLLAWPITWYNKFPQFLSAYSHFPQAMHYAVMILLGVISLDLYPKHTNVYKTVTQLSSEVDAICEVPRDST